jgi:hypothetical protein
MLLLQLRIQHLMPQMAAVAGVAVSGVLMGCLAGGGYQDSPAVTASLRLERKAGGNE